jgi:hypothetical protein
MKLVHEFEEMPPEKRPQDIHGDGRFWTFVTPEHGGEYPDTIAPGNHRDRCRGRSCM